jgi:hypothetical protein
MRMLIATLLVLAGAGACTGAAPGGTRTCAGNLYDACLDEHDCMLHNCYNFMAAQFQVQFEVCSVACTVGDDTPCMTNDHGQKATCKAIGDTSAGICTPPAENDCMRAP